MKLKFELILFSIIIIGGSVLSHNAFSQDKSIDRLVGNWKCFEIEQENCSDTNLNGVKECPGNIVVIFYPDETSVVFRDGIESTKNIFKVSGNSIAFNDDDSQNLTFYIEDEIFSFVDPSNDSCYETQRFKRIK